MKYDFGYALLQEISCFLSRNLLFFKRIEIKYLLDLLSHEKGEKILKILDYGCNTGYYTNLINNLIPESEVCGADINPYALERARKKYKNINFFEVDEGFFKKNQFDVIVISHVLEHIKEREDFMKNLSRILSDRGKVILTIPQERIRGDTAFQQILYNILRFRLENPHVVKLSYDDLKDLLNKTDFRIDDRAYANYFFPFKSRSRKFYSFSLVVSASKV